MGFVRVYALEAYVCDGVEGLGYLCNNLTYMCWCCVAVAFPALGYALTACLELCIRTVQTEKQPLTCVGVHHGPVV